MFLRSSIRVNFFIFFIWDFNSSGAAKMEKPWSSTSLEIVKTQEEHILQSKHLLTVFMSYQKKFAHHLNVVIQRGIGWS